MPPTDTSRRAPVVVPVDADAAIPSPAGAARPPPPDAARPRPSDVSDALAVGPSELHGLGLFAAAPLAAGTVLGRLVGMPTREDGTYVLWLSDELGLELVNDFRFINHSARPNCELTDIDVVTLRDVAAGEELTHRYHPD